MRRPAFVETGTICALLLLLIVVRCQGEIIRQAVFEGAGLPELWLYVNGSIAAALAAAAVVVLSAYRQRAATVAITALTIAGLVVYKLAVVGL